MRARVGYRLVQHHTAHHARHTQPREGRRPAGGRYLRSPGCADLFGVFGLGDVLLEFVHQPVQDIREGEISPGECLAALTPISAFFPFTRTIFSFICVIS